MAERQEFVVDDVEIVADHVAMLTLRPLADDTVPSWEPGAHVGLELDGGAILRQYSLCGDPADRTRLRVAVLREETGRGGSTFVHDRLRAGDKVAIGGPRNHFALAAAPAYRFVAGGIGITPLLPMIRQVAEAGADWRLLYGGRTRTSMAFVAELSALGGERVAVRPQDEFGLLPIEEFVAAAPVGAAVYCCGPAPLLLAIDDVCGVHRGVTLRVERFAPGPAAARGCAAAGSEAPEPAGGFEVELARSGRVLAVPASLSLLEVLEDAGVPMESSCREGTCGTCETAVVDGVPDHRDSLLTDEARAANDVMFPCVSRCRSARLVLDL